jgi:hypothetical protein
VFAIVYTFSPGFVGSWFAERMRRGYGDRVNVELSRADSLVSMPDSSTMLLGTTSEFLFLYRRDIKQSYVVPKSSLWQLRICNSEGGLLTGRIANCPP